MYAEASHCLSRAVGLDPRNAPLQKELVRCLQLKAVASRDERKRGESAAKPAQWTGRYEPPAITRPSDGAYAARRDESSAASCHSADEREGGGASPPRGAELHDGAQLPSRRDTKVPFWKKKLGGLIKGVACCGRRGPAGLVPGGSASPEPALAQQRSGLQGNAAVW
jgi:hypothetical protein